MQFKLNGQPRDEWANVFHVSRGQNAAALGDRYPALWVNKNSYFGFIFDINGHKNYNKKYDDIKFGGVELYVITIEQKNVNGKWMYQVFVDGQLFLSKENTLPITVEEAKLYLSDPWYEAANIEFTYFRMEY